MTESSALVFGGGGGIGAAISRRLAAEHAVTIGCCANADRAAALRDELIRDGLVAAIVQSDATAAVGVEAAFDAATQLGELGVVVSCVGGWDYKRLAELSGDDIDNAITLNLRSALLILAESARRVNDGGRVVMLSSAAAYVAPSRQATYAAAKSGLEVAARVASKEMARRGITVNVVRPGATDTATLRDGTSERAIEAMAGSNAMRRLGSPEDIAGAVMMLCSSDAAWVTGNVIDATGGLW